MVLAITDLMRRADFTVELEAIGRALARSPEVSPLARELLRPLYKRRWALLEGCEAIMHITKEEIAVELAKPDAPDFEKLTKEKLAEEALTEQSTSQVAQTIQTKDSENIVRTISF